MTTPSANNTKFKQLRENYPCFIYEDYYYKVENDAIQIKFKFNLAGKYTFSPTLWIPFKKFFNLKHLPLDALENMVFHIGMIELISYWKAACSPQVIIKSYMLDENQLLWWKNLYFLGLGEFFYLNGIETSRNTFMSLSCESNRNLSKTVFVTDDSYIVPVGGGKDSAVTLELLKNKHHLTPLVINPRQATNESIRVAGYTAANSFEIFRTIDPLLLDLNSRGFLNGHTPFSALLAFVSLLAGAVSGKKNIALSNEASANESTVLGQEINHQYSKSFQFERDFRNYVSAYICDDINYFSFLRPLHEIQIAYLFSKFPDYFKVFKSCNAGSKTDTWCCNCPKCLFSYIILSPFIPNDKMKEIFGENLFEKSSLLPMLDKLSGIDPVKPFECIGTLGEVNLALDLSLKKYNDPLPSLLYKYKNSITGLSMEKLPAEKWKNLFDDDHFLNDEDLRILKEALGC